MKLVKLDRRHTGYGFMKYYVEPNAAWAIGLDHRFEQFQQWRTWCWEVFGPGVERKYISITPEDAGSNGECHMVSKDRWSWYTEEKEMRLYFKDDETASAFSFQWS